MKNNIAHQQKLNNMTEEPNIENNSNTSEPETEKLLIDNPANFQFHAAYMVYDETFDKASEDSNGS